MATNRIFKDFFTQIADVDLVAHAPSGFGSSWVEEERTGVPVQRIQAVDDYAESDRTGLDDRHIYTCRPAPNVNEYDLNVKLLNIATTGLAPWFFVARFTDTSNYYSAGTYAANNAADKKIFKKVTSTVTEIATGDSNAVDNDTLKFEVRDATKKLYHNGSEVLSSGDNALSSIGVGGFGLGNAWISTEELVLSWRADNFTIDELTTANINWPDAVSVNGDTSPLDTPNITVSGSDKVLLVITAVSVTDAGKKVTDVKLDPDNTNQDVPEVNDYGASHGKGRIQIHRLINPTNVTDKPIRVTHADKCAVVAFILNGADQTTPLSDYTSADATSTSPSVTVPNATSGDYVFDVLAHLDLGNGTVGANQTVLFNFSGAGAFDFQGSRQDGVDGGVMSWTLSQSKEWAQTGFNVKAPSGATTPLLLTAVALGVVGLTKIRIFVRQPAVVASGVVTFSQLRTFARAPAIVATGVVALSRAFSFLGAITAVAVPVIVKQVEMTKAITAASVVTFSQLRPFASPPAIAALGVVTFSQIRTFARASAIVATGVVALSRAFSFLKAIAATAVPVIVKQVEMTKAITAVGVVTRVNVYLAERLLPVVAAGLVTFGRAITFVQAPAIVAAGVVTLSKTISKILAVTATGVADLVQSVTEAIKGLFVSVGRSSIGRLTGDTVGKTKLWFHGRMRKSSL